MKHIWIVAIAALATLLAATGCTSDNTSAAAGSSSAVSSGAAGSGSSSAASSASSPNTGASSAAAGSGGSGGAPCTQAQLTVTDFDNGPGAGQHNVVVIFTNATAAACTVQGYPGVAGIDQEGNQIAEAVRTGPAGATLTLPPGGTVSASLLSTSVPSGTITQCGSFNDLLVTPPNTTASTRLAVPLPSCGFRIQSVVAGSGG